MKEKIQELTDLLMETEQAHRRAFSETNGFDPDWPIWYADYLFDRISPLLEANMSRSELVYLLVHLSKVQPADAPGANWPRYYTRYLVERYL
jgi:hypothetical protein